MLHRHALTTRPACISPLPLAAAFVASLFASEAGAVIFLPEEAFVLPEPFLNISAGVVARPAGAFVGVRDSDSSQGDPTQTIVASAEAGIAPGGAAPTAVNAFGVVRANPAGGISLGWATSILATPTADLGAGPVELAARGAGVLTEARTRFSANVPQGGVADVDFDLGLAGQLSFRFDRPLASVTTRVISDLTLRATVYSTRYGSRELLDLDYVFDTDVLRLLAAGPQTLNGFDLVVTDILDGGQVVGKNVDYLTTIQLDDIVFAQDGDELGLRLFADLQSQYSGTELLDFALNFDRTFDGLPASDTPGAAFSTVPLPASAWLLVSGLAAGLAFRRRQGRQQPGSGRPAGTTNEVNP